MHKSHEYTDAHSAVTKRIEMVASAPWPAPPNGYPRIRPEKFGPRAARIAQRRLDNGELPLQPPQRAMLGPGQAAIANTFSAAIVAISVVVVLAGVMGAARPGDGMAWMLAILLGGCGMTLALELPQLAAHAITTAAGYRWNPAGIEYVPWTRKLTEPSEPETSSGAAGKVTTADSQLRTPKDWVGPDAAIVLVAEQLAAEIRDSLRTLDPDSEEDPNDPAIDLDKELHEIAWGVADLEALKPAGSARDDAAQQRRAAAASLRNALISRVTGLYLHARDVQQAVSQVADQLAPSSGAELGAQSDLSDAYAAAWLHEQAAGRIHPAARPDAKPQFDKALRTTRGEQ